MSSPTTLSLDVIKETVTTFLTTYKLIFSIAAGLVVVKFLYSALKPKKTRSYDPNIVYVFNFPHSKLAAPSASPYVLKVISFLEYHKIQYKVIYTNDMGPRSKHPRAYIDGELVCDSHFIIKTLQKKFNITDEIRDPKVVAGMAMTRRFMDDAYAPVNIVHPRWVDPSSCKGFLDQVFSELPFFLTPLRSYIQKQVTKQLYQQGTGRYSLDELREIQFTDLSSLSTLLGENRFFFGTNKLTYADITIFAHLAQNGLVGLDNVPNSYFSKHSNLVRFTNEVKQLIFSDDRWNELSGIKSSK
eukprot:gene4167-5216_t